MRPSSAQLVRATATQAMRTSTRNMFRVSARRAEGHGSNPDPFIPPGIGIMKDPQVERFAEMRQNMYREWEWNRKSTTGVLLWIFLLPGLVYYGCSKISYNQPAWHGIARDEPLEWPPLFTPEREEYMKHFLHGTLVEFHKQKVAEACGAAATEEEDEDEDEE